MLLGKKRCDQRYTLGKLCRDDIVKINKKKFHLNWSWEALCGPTLHTLIINYSKQEETCFLSPTGRYFSTLLFEQQGGSPPHPATTQSMKDC